VLHLGHNARRNDHTPIKFSKYLRIAKPDEVVQRGRIGNDDHASGCCGFADFRRLIVAMSFSNSSAV
jgi:hypothetical protein